ncbi:hypothetical protein POTOM_021054 [Populus tomentosa]|uniref:Uncharacterized protein n=1 Tax=Populus tomentosa TaxID=118781 RepID=A0A8X8D127_POPTO|nr:hypothetical protein POTOM_021054 [Populus tomentosa]
MGFWTLFEVASLPIIQVLLISFLGALMATEWFMPVNIGFTFLIGGILGWILVKIVRPKPYLEGLVIATCSSG